MGILEIIMVGYIVNIILLVIMYLLTFIQVLIKFMSIDKVERVKNVVDRQIIYNNYVKVKERLRSNNLSTINKLDLGMLFPFAVLIDFSIILYHFIKFDLDIYIFNKILDRTTIFEKRIKDHKESKKLEDSNE